MIKHMHTQKAEVNFTKLEERLMAINNPILNKANNMRELLYQLTVINKPTLLMATGGSKIVAHYLQLILERLDFYGIISEVIEPRDYFYKYNKNIFSNLIAISTSGTTNGIKDALEDFNGNKFLICENDQKVNYPVISWGNELYDSERSFISLASCLSPITLMLDATTSLTKQMADRELEKINHTIKRLLNMSSNKTNDLKIDFKNTNLIQIISGYDTKCASSVLESNLAEVGLCSYVTHDKGSFCHGRSNLLFQYPNSHVIYLYHNKTELDEIIIDLISTNYSNISIFETSDLEENYFWKEYYLLIQMYFLSKKIADDKKIDLTQPEYNPQIVKRLYKFKGEM